MEFDPLERRILGTLIEKCLTTPDYYPMTTKAIVAGCNQKNNRDPVSAWSEDDIRAGLASLQAKHAVMAVRPDGGHATRWRHELDRGLGTAGGPAAHGTPAIQGRELALLGELLLRGPQTEGELRARASRMRAFPDLEALHETLQRLREWTPPLAVRLSADGAVRGVRHAHALYPAAEMAELTASEGAQMSEAATHAVPPHAADEASKLRARLARMESRLSRIESFLNAELGASFPLTDSLTSPPESDGE